MTFKFWIKLTTDSTWLKSLRLILLEFSLDSIIKLLDIIVESLCISFHFFNDKLKFIFLSFFFFLCSLKLFFLHFVLSFSLSFSIHQFFNFLSFSFSFSFHLFSFLFPPILNILNELSILLLCFDNFFMKIFHSSIEDFILDCHLRHLLIEKSNISLILATHDLFFWLNLMEWLMKIFHLIVCKLSCLVYLFLKMLYSCISFLESVSQLFFHSVVLFFIWFYHFVFLFYLTLKFFGFFLEFIDDRIISLFDILNVWRMDFCYSLFYVIQLKFVLSLYCIVFLS